MSALEAAAEAWVAPYWNARHLVRARDWLLVLAPDADEVLRVAALTHDMERHFPGGPAYDPATMTAGEEEYYTAHAQRSAGIVADWAARRGAAPAEVDELRRLVALHEVGGDPRADLVQAADALSFLEVNGETVVRRWVEEGRCDRARGIAQLDYMRDRIRHAAAVPLARPLHEEAVRGV